MSSIVCPFDTSHRDPWRRHKVGAEKSKKDPSKQQEKFWLKLPIPTGVKIVPDPITPAHRELIIKRVKTLVPEWFPLSSGEGYFGGNFKYKVENINATTPPLWIRAMKRVGNVYCIIEEKDQFCKIDEKLVRVIYSEESFFNPIDGLIQLLPQVEDKPLHEQISVTSFYHNKDGAFTSITMFTNEGQMMYVKINTIPLKTQRNAKFNWGERSDTVELTDSVGKPGVYTFVVALGKKIFEMWSTTPNK